MRGISSGTGDRPDHRQPAVAAADPPPSLRRGQRLATQWHRPRTTKAPINLIIYAAGFGLVALGHKLGAKRRNRTAERNPETATPVDLAH